MFAKNSVQLQNVWKFCRWIWLFSVSFVPFNLKIKKQRVHEYSICKSLKSEMQRCIFWKFSESTMPLVDFIRIWDFTPRKLSKTTKNFIICVSIGSTYWNIAITECLEIFENWIKLHFLGTDKEDFPKFCYPKDINICLCLFTTK